MYVQSFIKMQLCCTGQHEEICTRKNKFSINLDHLDHKALVAGLNRVQVTLADWNEKGSAAAFILASETPAANSFNASAVFENNMQIRS